VAVAHRFITVSCSIRLSLLILLSCLLAPPHAQAAESKLNLLIWSEYIDPEVVKDFQRAHQCRVVIDLFDEDAAMIAKLRNGGSRTYDIVVAPDHTIPRLRRLGLIRQLGSNALSSLPLIHPTFRSPSFDPENRYSMPYLWGTLCIYARKPAAGQLEPSWGLLFDPAAQPGAFLFSDSMRDVIGAALKYRGKSLNTTDKKALLDARDLILAAKRRSRGFEGGVGGKNKVLARRVSAAMAYSGDALRGAEEDPETICILPREGTQIWVDNLVVCSGAPNPGLAERFITFVSEPKVAARLANYLHYATPNEAARPWISPEALANPSIYPPKEVMDRLEFLQDLGKDSRLYDEVWSVIRVR